MPKDTDVYRPGAIDLDDVPTEITERDEARFSKLVKTSLEPEQIARIVEPPLVESGQKRTLAVHWHPEFIPLNLVEKRLAAMFPAAEEDLIIPTQHNAIMSWGSYCGAEIDCYSSSFHRKVQLLVHFSKERLEKGGDVFEGMLAHTARYRRQPAVRVRGFAHGAGPRGQGGGGGGEHGRPRRAHQVRADPRAAIQGYPRARAAVHPADHDQEQAAHRLLRRPRRRVRRAAGQPRPPVPQGGQEDSEGELLDRALLRNP